MREAWLEDHEDREPVRHDPQEEARDGQEDAAPERTEVVEGNELDDSTEEAHPCAASLNEAELLLTKRQEEGVQQLFVLGEDLNDHAVVVNAELLITEKVDDLDPQLRARLLDHVDSRVCDLQKRLGRQHAVDHRKVRGAHVGERARDDLGQLLPCLGHDMLRIHAHEPGPRPFQVRPGALVGHLRHLPRLARHDALPADAHARALVLVEAHEVQRHEHHLDCEPDVEPGEEQRDHGDRPQERDLPRPSPRLVVQLLVH
mmetsp:Transcript_89311/g.230519  ORF Transcript_89311/g.230519 Transcript_89311/m.230519 type:complete len:259 (-) Transcript_89311:398-1174(-)